MKKLLFTILAGLIGFTSYSQKTASDNLNDGKNLIEAYIGPLGNSLGAALNNGWYNTAKPHSLGGFDVTITASLVIVPADAKTFNISNSNGSTVSGGETPTILGEGNGSSATLMEDGVEIGKYKMPGGVNLPYIPLPMLQAGVGLIKGTELDFRYVPKIDWEKFSTGLWGVGVKHDILQWLSIVDKIPIDISIQAGYTKLNSEITLEDPSATNLLPQSYKTSLDVSATTVNLILSKKLLMFTPYLGLGYNSTKTTFNVEEGNYKIAGLDMKDLTEIDFESNNNLRANIGFRFNITLLALQANYTFAEYPTATLGLGISVR